MNNPMEGIPYRPDEVSQSQFKELEKKVENLENIILNLTTGMETQLKMLFDLLEQKK